MRVPVYRAHSESIYAEFEKPLSVDEVRRALAGAEGVKLIDDRKNNYFPMPIEASGKDEILAGRIRVNDKRPQEVCLFVSGDQIRKGAALNAVQIAEIWARTASSVNV